MNQALKQSMICLAFIIHACSGRTELVEPSMDCDQGQRHEDCEGIEGQKSNTLIKSVPKPDHATNSSIGSQARGELYKSAMTHVDHPKVQKWIKYFKNNGAEIFQRFLNRGAHYKSYIEQQLESRGLPKELYYLAMIESGFNTKARSRARAAGIWQFMAATGRRYGLRVDHYIDERYDPHKATLSAMKYLEDLHRVYQSWWLAIASYNSGEYRILNAIMKKNTRKYFELVDEKALPRETQNYVPKFIAALMLGENAEYYGFKLENQSNSDFKELETINIFPGVTLNDIAEISGCSSSLLKQANPQFMRSIIHSRKKVPVYLPNHCDKGFSVTKLKKVGQKRMIAMRRDKKSYRVKRGDTLLRIAKRHSTTVREIKRMNRLRTSIIYPGQSLKLTSSQSIRHRVKNGENLHLIAKKYRTSIRRIKKDNDLKRTIIYPGQIIKISLKKII